MSFEVLVAAVIQREGGYVNDTRDSGGETKYGITIATARAYGYLGPMREMTQADAARVYKLAFWDTMKLSDIETIAPLVADELFDTAVNQGTVAAGKYFQRALNVFNQGSVLYADIDADGQIGAMTVAAFREFMRARARDGELVMLRALNALQGAFYIELAEKRAKDEAFVFGWLRNRVT